MGTHRHRTPRHRGLVTAIAATATALTVTLGVVSQAATQYAGASAAHEAQTAALSAARPATSPDVQPSPAGTQAPAATFSQDDATIAAVQAAAAQTSPAQATAPTSPAQAGATSAQATSRGDVARARAAHHPHQGRLQHAGPRHHPSFHHRPDHQVAAPGGVRFVSHTSRPHHHTQTADHPVAHTGGALHAAPHHAAPHHAAVSTDRFATQGTAHLTLVTANVPYTLSQRRAVEQLRHVYAADSDVVVFQEVRAREVGQIAADVAPSGRWQVFQPPHGSGARASAVAWDPHKFDVLDTGYTLGFDGQAYDRYFVWAVLRDRATGTVVTPVAAHWPVGAGHSAQMRGYYKTMNANYATLVAQLRARGLSPITGADWNAPLGRIFAPWAPLEVNQSIGMRTNWVEGTPCVFSAHHGRIDGFAYDPTRVSLSAQQCLPKKNSDHRPVLIDVDAH